MHYGKCCPIKSLQSLVISSTFRQLKCIILEIWRKDSNFSKIWLKYMSLQCFISSRKITLYVIYITFSNNLFIDYISSFKYFLYLIADYNFPHCYYSRDNYDNELIHLVITQRIRWWWYIRINKFHIM